MSQLSINPELSQLLAVEAATIHPAEQAEEALIQSLLESHITAG